MEVLLNFLHELWCTWKVCLYACNTWKTCESGLKTRIYSGHLHMKTYIHLCAYLEGNSLNIYWSKEYFQQLWKKNKNILYPTHFSIIAFKIIKQKNLIWIRFLNRSWSPLIHTLRKWRKLSHNGKLPVAICRAPTYHVGT